MTEAVKFSKLMVKIKLLNLYFIPIIFYTNKMHYFTDCQGPNNCQNPFTAKSSAYFSPMIIIQVLKYTSGQIFLRQSIWRFLLSVVSNIWYEKLLDLCHRESIFTIFSISGKAIKHAREVLFTGEAGMRKGIPKVLVVITDGRSQDDVNKVSREMQLDGKMCSFKNYLYFPFFSWIVTTHIYRKKKKKKGQFCSKWFSNFK